MFDPGRHFPVPYLGGPEGPEPALGGGGPPNLRIVVRSLQQAPRRVSMHADGKHWQPRAEPHSLVAGYHAGAGDSENAPTQAWAGRPNWVLRAMRV